jgi:protein TonB
MSTMFLPTRPAWAVAGSGLVLVLALPGLRAWRSAAVPAAAAVADDSGGRGILLGLADEALRDRRLVAPQGRNAWEFYLSVLELEPDDGTTRETLHRLFPAAIRAVEQAIDRGELDQAERELRLLREFDSGNYIALLLAGKLDAQRRLPVRQDEMRAAVLQARRAAQPAR